VTLFGSSAWRNTQPSDIKASQKSTFIIFLGQDSKNLSSSNRSLCSQVLVLVLSRILQTYGYEHMVLKFHVDSKVFLQLSHKEIST